MFNVFLCLVLTLKISHFSFFGFHSQLMQAQYRNYCNRSVRLTTDHSIRKDTLRCISVLVKYKVTIDCVNFLTPMQANTISNLSIIMMTVADPTHSLLL